MSIIQLREKTLNASDLESLTGEVVCRVNALGSFARVLVSAAAAAAVRANAHGVHLPGPPVAGSVEGVRALFRAAGGTATVSMACHSPEEAAAARTQSPDLLLYAPVFEKPLAFAEGSAPAPRPRALPGQGLDALRRACIAAGPVPVYALGGITIENAALCLAAGAAGVAGIRLFARDGWQRLASGAANSFDVQ